MERERESFVGAADGLLVDAFGAAPIHALMIANNDESLTLAARLVAALPQLLLTVHAGRIGHANTDVIGYEPMRAGRLGELMAFGGENALHIALINKREDWALQARAARGLPWPAVLPCPCAPSTVTVPPPGPRCRCWARGGATSMR